MLSLHLLSAALQGEVSPRGKLIHISGNLVFMADTQGMPLIT